MKKLIGIKALPFMALEASQFLSWSQALAEGVAHALVNEARMLRGSVDQKMNCKGANRSGAPVQRWDTRVSSMEY
jgi:hypothetical protein